MSNPSRVSPNLHPVPLELQSLGDLFVKKGDQPPKAPVFQRLPDPQEFLLGPEFQMEPWLSKAVEALRGRGDLFGDAAALGLVARLFALDPLDPSMRQLRQTYIRRVKADDGGMDRLRKWAPTLSSEQILGLDQAIDLRIDVWEEVVRELDDLYEAGASNLHDLALLLAHDRDDIESATLILELLGHAMSFEEQLFRLDALLTEKTRHIRERNKGLDDDRLSTIHWSGPHGWWCLILH